MKKLFLAILPIIIIFSALLHGQDYWSLNLANTIIFDAIALGDSNIVCAVDSGSGDGHGGFKMLVLIQDRQIMKKFCLSAYTNWDYMFNSLAHINNGFCAAYNDTLYRFNNSLDIISQTALPLYSDTKIYESLEYVFITEVFSNKFLVFDKDLQLLKTVDLTSLFAIGNIVYRDNFVYIAAKQKDGSNYVMKYDLDGQEIWRKTMEGSTYVDRGEDGIFFGLNGKFGILDFDGGNLMWSDSLPDFSITSIKTTATYSFTITGSRDNKPYAAIYEKNNNGEYGKIWEHSEARLGQYSGVRQHPEGLLVFGNESICLFPNPCVGVAEEAEVPINFTLSQNYPNPFNPSTTIKFNIPKAEYVTLKVYDALGKEAAALVDEELSAGTYEQNFDAGNLSSGVYFYTLQAGQFITSKKMLLLK